MSNIVYEWCESSAPHHTQVFIPQETLINKTGFQSVFGYQNLQRGAIPKAGNTTLFTDKIFIDVDSLEKSASILANRLKDQEVNHEVWFSGSKGYHFVINVIPMVGPCIDQSVKQFITNNFSDIQGVDTSMIHTRGLIRLPGTKHRDTGKKKTLVDIFECDRPIEVPTGVIKFPEVFTIPEDPHEAAEVAFTTIVRAYKFPATAGKRTVTFWRIAKTLDEAGYTANETFDILHKINRSWPDSKDDETITRVVKQVYGL